MTINSLGVPSGIEGPGSCPIGSMLAIASVVAWTLPTTGQIKNGWALANGQAIPAGAHPSFSGNLPNLSDSRFLQGSTTIGTTGGANSIDFSHTHSVTSNVSIANHAKLIASDIPQISTNYTPVGTTNIAHGHTVSESPHSHTSRVAWSSDTNSAGLSGAGATYGAGQASQFWAGSGTYAASTGLTVNALGATNVSLAGTLATITVGTVVGSQTQLTHSTTNNAVTSGSGLTSTDVRPQYFNVIYVMRVV